MISLAFKILWSWFACSQCLKMTVIPQLQIKCGQVSEDNKVKWHTPPLKIVTTILSWCDHWLPDSERLLSWTAHLFLLSCSPAWDLSLGETLLIDCMGTCGYTMKLCYLFSYYRKHSHMWSVIAFGFLSIDLTPTLGLIYLQWKFVSKSTKPALSFQAPWGGTRKKSHQISNSVSRSPAAWEFIHDSQAPRYLSAASSVLLARFSREIICNARRGALRS